MSDQLFAQNTIPHVNADGTGGHYGIVETGKQINGTFVADQAAQNVSLLAGAARTANTSSADQVNPGFRGLLVYLNVTAASGTGGLTLAIDFKDALSGQYRQVFFAGTAITTVPGRPAIYSVYPATLSSSFDGTLAMPLAATWRVRVQVGDNSSYTYSVSADVLP